MTSVISNYILKMYCEFYLSRVILLSVKSLNDLLIMFLANNHMPRVSVLSDDKCDNKVKSGTVHKIFWQMP